MSKYKIYIASGEYSDRQHFANDIQADLYLEQHVNSSVSESPDYGLGVVAVNASGRSKEIARWYAEQAGKRFDVGGPLDADIGYGTGVRVGGRGNANLVLTNMPAIILEPWFASNPKQATRMTTQEGINSGAQLIIDTLYKFLPDKGTVVLSVGHLNKPSQPNDRGAPLADGLGWEADWSAEVVELVEKKFKRVKTDTQLQDRDILQIRRSLGQIETAITAIKKQLEEIINT